jgi:hypothetical protein
MKYAILMAVILFSQASDYCNFKKGTTWLYDRTSNSTDVETVDEVKMTVTESGDNKMTVVLGDMITQSKVMWHISDGYLVWTIDTSELKVLKCDSKKDDKWIASKSLFGDMDVITEATNLGVETLETKIGKIDTVHVALTISVEGNIMARINVYLSPKYGLVKLSMANFDGSMVSIILKAFKNG